MLDSRGQMKINGFEEIDVIKSTRRYSSFGSKDRVVWFSLSPSLVMYVLAVNIFYKNDVVFLIKMATIKIHLRPKFMYRIL